MKKIALLMSLLFVLGACGSKQEKKVIDNTKKVEKQISVKPEVKKTELEETAIQTNLDNKIELGENDGILVVRFLLIENAENQLKKLPNFRIRGEKKVEIDNSPKNIQKDAIHVFKLPKGRYNISSLYSVNKKGEYEFDKPFPPNRFTIEAGKINYIGDIKVRMIEEKKSSNIYTRKLKLKLPANNDETIQIIQERFKNILKKFQLEKRIIHF